jgi:ArsR family transcriptional regulator
MTYLSEIRRAHRSLLFLQALANVTRLQIVLRLREGSLSVGEISSSLGYEQSRISHNLRCLTFCGIVKASQKGKERIYSLNKKTIQPILKAMNRHIEKYGENLETCETISDARRLEVLRT